MILARAIAAGFIGTAVVVAVMFIGAALGVIDAPPPMTTPATTTTATTTVTTPVAPCHSPACPPWPSLDY